jgi:hypothetical protein
VPLAVLIMPGHASGQQHWQQSKHHLAKMHSIRQQPIEIGSCGSVPWPPHEHVVLFYFEPSLYVCVLCGAWRQPACTQPVVVW